METPLLAKLTGTLTSDMFFMKDRIQEDEINIIYCPTELMVAVYFTKALQCSL